MKKDFTEIILVVDRSASMSSVRQKTISGLKEFLDTQKALPGEAALSLITFSSDYKIDISGKNVKDIESSVFDDYRTSGCTALLDAVGVAIDTTGERFAAMEEKDRPEKVMFVIVTDGEENSSKEYDFAKVKDIVKHQEDVYKWEFLFLGADIDAFESGRGLGFSKSKTVSVDKFDMAKNFKKATVYTASYRGSNLLDTNNDFDSVGTGYFNMTDDSLNDTIEKLKAKDDSNGNR